LVDECAMNNGGGIFFKRHEPIAPAATTNVRMAHSKPSSPQETPMLNRSSLLAFAAVATLSLAAFAPTSASARFGGNGGGHNFGGHGGPGVHLGSAIRVGHGFHGGNNFHFRRPPIRIVRWHHPHWRPLYVRPQFVSTTYAAVRPVTYAAAVRPATCNCLTKEYLEDGTVMFKDLCTKEMAMNPPVQEQAQGPGPQAQ
jgi:hypothetical protein